MTKETSIAEIDIIMQQSWEAFREYRKLPLSSRAAFMRSIAEGLEQSGSQLIETAMKETNLPEARLTGERARTIFQLRSYADACEAGTWLDARIDTAIPDRKPIPKPDIRKMLIPLGPVVVFGASNFPFAYSTAGGDTACAFAAGCPVVVKAHPAHPATSALVASIILTAAHNCNMPQGIFAHVFGASPQTGRALVQHPRTAAVGFTGSYSGGKQLFDWGNQRTVPIPVFAEMGSVNPVFLLSEKLEKDHSTLAELLSASVTLGVGQFCTNPGLIIGVAGNALEHFITTLGELTGKVAGARMLHDGISAAYAERSTQAVSQPGVNKVSAANGNGQTEGIPVIATVAGSRFLANPLLQEEVFGPYSIVVSCSDATEMLLVAKSLKGQLTSTLMATAQDMRDHTELIEAVKDICGRFIVNSVPTGVEVCASMQHGGPFPASTDSRFTAVGADGIRRFARPIAYQHWPSDLLPQELQDHNPLGIWRTVNDKMTRDGLAEG